MERIESQKKSIRKYLESGKKITPILALNLFGCFRLGARIWELKNEGCSISSELVERNGKRFSEYSIKN